MFLELLALGSAVGNVLSGRALRRGANAAIAEGDRLADDATARGEELARRYGIDLAQLLGTQRAIGAAQGLDTNQGTLAAIRSDTERIGGEELALIRENARREAFGLRQSGRNQAIGLRAQATGAYGQAFGNVLEFGANAWSSRQRSRGARFNAAATKLATSPGGASWL